MGCSTSKLENEDVVISCKERRLLIKQAVEHRYEFAEAHLAYINALKNVGSALRFLIEGQRDENISMGCSIPNSPPAPKTETTVNHLRTGSTPTPPLYFEDIPPSPQNVRVESYSIGMDGLFSTQSYLPQSPSSPPPSSSAWDLFNPFISLNSSYYSYHDQRRLSQVFDEDEIAITNMKKEEGIPELEEEKEAHTSSSADPATELLQPEVVTSEAPVESVADVLTQTASAPAVETVADTKAESLSEEIPVQEAGQVVAQEEEEKPSVQEVEDKQEVISSEKTNVSGPSSVTHKPKSMWQDIEDQFIRAYEYGKDVSALLEANKVQYSSGVNDIRVHSARILSGSISLIRSLARSSSSRTYVASSSKDDTDDSSSDFVDDYCMISGSHVSTLDTIYAWEKKLYDEVKRGERLRINCEKKCMQLRNQDDKGEDPEVVDKTRATIKKLQTQIKVSIHSVDSISKRIQKLSSEELEPQLAELIRGLMQMWRGMFECHQIQYQKIKDVNSLSSAAVCGMLTESHHKATGQLVNVLHDWHRSFSKWFSSQKAYVQGIYGWLTKCIMPESKSSSNSRMRSLQHSTGAPPIFIICHNWYHAFGPMPEKLVIEKVGNFTSDVHALWEQQDKELRQKKTAEYPHQNVLYQTQNAILRTLTGLEPTFDALTQFASVAFKEYKELHEKNCSNEISHI